MDSRVARTMEPYLSRQFYNPSATYLAARAVRQALNQARHGVAQLIGARPAEVVFTAGATEANNLAIQGLMRQYPKGEVLVSTIEHESVLGPAGLFKHKKIPVNKSGIVQIDRLANLIDIRTVLISVMLVNNELGTIQPLRELAKLIEEVRQARLAKANKLPIYLHTDAAQAGNYLDLHASRLGVDMMSLNGGKIYGPKQSGILYIKAGTNLRPLIVGGGQEFGLRSGTENVAAAIGFSCALEIAQRQRAAESNRITKLRQDFETKLQKQIKKVMINGAKKQRAPHLLSVSFPGFDNERLMMELDERGIQCAVGSACSASRDEASPVLSAIGLDEPTARATLRFSLGRQITAAELDHVLRVLVELTA